MVRDASHSSAVLVFALVGLLQHSCQATHYHGYKVIRFAANESTAAWLDSLENNVHDYKEKGGEERRLFDVWSEPTKLQEWADVMVAPEYYDRFLHLLRQRGITEVEHLQNDVQTVIDSELQQINEAKKRRRRRKRFIASSVDTFDEKNYHSYDGMVRFMHDLVREHSNIAKIINISTSFEGRTIYGIKLSVSSTYKPSIVIDAGVHAREWIAPASALYIIKKLVKSYGKNEQLTKALHAYDWFIIPELNPDGYEYSREKDRLWRKTRSRNITANRFCVGADANRNWGYKWGEAGANRSPCSNIYQGAHPFSEPEIIGLKNFLTWEIPNLVIYISLHSYGQVFLSPWGFTAERPQNYVDQRNAAQAAVAAMEKETGAKYNYGTISEVMYPASGTSIDYLQNKNVPYIYGVELRPLESYGTFGFNLPPAYIKPTGEESLAGILAIAEYALAQGY